MIADTETVIRKLIEGGMSPETAQQIAQVLLHWRVQGKPAVGWNTVTQQKKLLSAAHDFSLHLLLYEFCYGAESLLQATGVAYSPTVQEIEHANATALTRELNLPDFPALHAWSVQNRQAYWKWVLHRLGVRFMKPYSQLLDDAQPTQPSWLIDARLNIVESCFSADMNATAIVQSDGSGRLESISYGKLRQYVARVAGGLTRSGFGKGDSVAIVLPMSVEGVAGYLGIIASGGAAVTIPESFSSSEIATRLRIGGARLVITQDVIQRGGKTLPMYEKILIATELPTVVVTTDASFHPARDQDQLWKNFLSDEMTFQPVDCDPHDPISILFSSGTTGDPKAIPWDHTTPIKAAADAHFHQDLHPGDIACWPTSLGWMMGPWLIFGSLINRATIALYTQAPANSGFGQFVQDARVTMLGTVPSMVRAWRESGCMRGIDLGHIRAFSSTGECSNATEMLYLMHLAGYRPVIEYCGGTEVGGGYLSSTVVQPCVPAAFSTAALGMGVAIVDSAGKPAPRGEAFLIGPSIGLSRELLNRDHDEAYYRETPLLAGHPLLRRHGDELQKLANGYFRIIGRCDDTMNLGGIKVGCAEIERVLDGVAGVLETAAIALSPAGGGPSRLVVFAVVKEKITEDDLKKHLQEAIRSRLNPLFHLDQVQIVDALPRTASNKILRRTLRDSAGAPS